MYITRYTALLRKPRSNDSQWENSRFACCCCCCCLLSVLQNERWKRGCSAYEKKKKINNQFCSTKFLFQFILYFPFFVRVHPLPSSPPPFPRRGEELADKGLNMYLVSRKGVKKRNHQSIIYDVVSLSFTFSICKCIYSITTGFTGWTEESGPQSTACVLDTVDWDIISENTPLRHSPVAWRIRRPSISYRLALSLPLREKRPGQRVQPADRPFCDTRQNGDYLTAISRTQKE